MDNIGLFYTMAVSLLRFSSMRTWPPFSNVVLFKMIARDLSLKNAKGGQLWSLHHRGLFSITEKMFYTVKLSFTECVSM